MASLFAAASGRSDQPDGLGRTDVLTKQVNLVQSSFAPLVARFPPDYQRRVRDTDTGIGTGDGSDPGSSGGSASADSSANASSGGDPGS